MQFERSMRLRLRREVLLPLFTLGAFTAHAAPLLGAPGSGVSARSDTILVAGNPLEAASIAFARALAESSGDGLGAVLAAGGIRLHLDDSGHAGLSSRQAVASLRDFLRGYEGGTAFVARAAAVDGSPNRGFAEVLWSGRVAGTSQAMRRTLFLGLLRDSGEWRVDEVRLVR